MGIFLYEMLFGEGPFYADSLMKTYSLILSSDRQLKFPEDVVISDNAKDLIQRFLSDANVRLGRDGSASVKAHHFFKNSEWTFENINKG